MLKCVTCGKTFKSFKKWDKHLATNSGHEGIDTDFYGKVTKCL